MARPMETFVCVDFGMTGSVTRWRNNLSKSSWSEVQHKIPTKLAYNNDNDGGSLAAWGKCEGEPPENIKELFKSYMTSTHYPNLPGAPASKKILFRWIRDYLTAICRQTADGIDRHDYSSSWRTEKIAWSFTVPGSWAQSRGVVEDFRKVAQDAVYACFAATDKIRIYTNLTEGKASAICLLSHAKFCEFAVGDRVISCDIGGATTDIALSVVSSTAKMDFSMPLNVHPEGLICVDEKFIELVQQTLRNAGFSHNIDEVALEMSHLESFISARNEFPWGMHENRREIKFPKSFFVDDWPSRESERHESMTVIKENFLSVHRDVFESLFEDLTQQIEAGIDEVIKDLSSEECSRIVIGLCGGGSRVPHIINRLQGRYGDPIALLDHVKLEIRPEMATVIGSSLAWDQLELQKFITETRFGIKTKDGVLEWKDGKENTESSRFYKAPAWVITFVGSSRHKKQEHTIVAAATETIDAALTVQLTEIHIDIDLSSENVGVLSRTRKYYILCKIIGSREIVIEVRSRYDVHLIPSKSDGEWCLS